MLKVNKNLYIHSGHGVNGYYAQGFDGFVGAPYVEVGGPGYMGHDTPYTAYGSRSGKHQNVLAAFREFLEEYAVEPTTKLRKERIASMGF